MRWRRAFAKKGLKAGAVGSALAVTLVNGLYKHTLSHSGKIDASGHSGKVERILEAIYRHKEHFNMEELGELSELVMIKAQMDVEKLVDGKYFSEARVLVKKVMNVASHLSIGRFAEWGHEKLREIRTAERLEGRNNLV